jgi:hypothetical protein
VVSYIPIVTLLDSKQDTEGSGLDGGRRTWIQSRLNFLLNQILIYYRCYQICELCHIFKWSVTYLHVIVCPAFHWQDSNIYLVFFAFSSRPTSLLALIKVCVFLHGTYVITQQIHINNQKLQQHVLQQLVNHFVSVWRILRKVICCGSSLIVIRCYQLNLACSIMSPQYHLLFQ